MKIFTIGGSGMVGSRLTELLEDKYQIDDLSLTNGVDITDPSSLDIIKNDKEHEIVLHLAAKADVDGCEADKDQGENGAAYRINVGGTQNIVDVCKATKKKMLYISTDFVFDGKKEVPNAYSEEDTPDPINWYAMTKYKGEEVVKNSGIDYTILRIAYPYRSDKFELKNDFIHAIMERLSKNLPVAAITDHIMTPTFIDDIAYAIDAIIAKNGTGIYHIVGSQSLSPYDVFQLVAKQFGYDTSLISKTTREAYFKGKALRPFNLSLSNARIEKLGITMRTFEEGLKKISKS